MGNEPGMWYENLTYQELKASIGGFMQSMARDFVAVGFYLKQVRDREEFKQDGYKDIWEFAEGLYGISRSTCSRWMSVNDRFSKNGNSPVLAEEYKGYGKSQLQEMLYLEDEQLEAVTPDMPTRAIRSLKGQGMGPDAGADGMCGAAQAGPDGDGNGSPAGHSGRGCITGWSRYPEFCSCCGLNGAECCSQCGEDCNGRCGWPDDPYIPEGDTPGQAMPENHAGLPDEAGSCAAPHKEGGIPQAGPETGEPPGGCLYRDGFACTLPEYAKRMPGDGQGCGRKCCWGCTERPGCKLECNSSRTREEDGAEGTEPAAGVEYREAGDEGETGPAQAADAYAAEAQQEEKYEELPELPDIELLRGKLDRERMTFAAMRREFTDDDRRVRTQRLVIDALASYICELDSISNPPPEQAQPELPPLKNNEQRKEWLRSYTDWGLWYEDGHIGCKYYKYDFRNGARIIAEAYHLPGDDWMEERDVYYLHLVGGPEAPKDKTGCCRKWQRHEKYNRGPNNETELAEFLKYVQKEGGAI